MAAPGFDPRFDPAFQPGYDPNPRVASIPSPERLPDPTPVAIAEPEASPLLPPQPKAPERAIPPDGLSPTEATSASTLHRNPLLIALWVISGVLVASGIYGIRLVADRVNALGSSGGFGEADYYLMQAYTVLSPLLIALGVATAIGTVFLLAVRWSGQR